MKISLDSIEVLIRYYQYWYPNQDKYYLSVHSPEVFPVFRIGYDFTEIVQNQNYMVTFSVIDIDRTMSEKGQSCKVYERRLRSDCIAKCLLKMIGQETMDVEFLRAGMLFRLEHLDDFQDVNISIGANNPRKNSPSKDPMIDVYQECYRSCKQNCKAIHYLYDISAIGVRSGPPPPSPPDQKETRIILQHNRLPDLFVRHIPESTFISFISNFGGLLGMWLGVSVLFIFDNMFKLVARIFQTMNKQQNERVIKRNNYSINSVKIFNLTLINQCVTRTNNFCDRCILQ